ncbi:hypothetical protein ABAC402_00660 [Asticcacaulis sp. AC402]|nr:hypothetical protein ABAC402_00660 [Asticcacaulis sp. AC402]
MFCSKCGTQNVDGAQSCVSCGTFLSASGGNGPTVSGYPGIHDIPNHLVWSILATLLCCLPFGIVAIIKSVSVDKFKSLGDAAGAKRAANEAKNWVIASVVSCVVIVVLYILFVVIIGVAASNS